MFLCSDRRAGSSASGIVRPASFYEAQTETTAQADERCSLVMPSVCLLCTVDWWLKQHKKAEWSLSPLGFWLQSVHLQTKRHTEKFIKELCVHATQFMSLKSSASAIFKSQKHPQEAYTWSTLQIYLFSSLCLTQYLHIRCNFQTENIILLS